MKQIAAYRCDHCKSVMLTAKAMKAHEEKCIKNPVQRTCCTCEHDTGGMCGVCLAGCRLDAVILVRNCAEWSPVEGRA